MTDSASSNSAKNLDVESKLKLQKRAIHEWYIGGILCSWILILLTYNFGNNDKLTAYISFALTISSILLALVAIGITVLGNSNLDQRFGELKHISGQMIDSSVRILEASNGINAKFPEIAESLTLVKEKTEETNLMFKQSINKKERNGDDGIINDSVNIISDDNEKNEVVTFTFKEFFELSSWAGRIIVYITSKRNEGGKKRINARAFAKFAESKGDEYYIGFQMAAVASNVMNVSNSGEIIVSPKWSSVKMYEYMQGKLIEFDKTKTSESERSFSNYIKILIAKAEEFSALSDSEMDEILSRED